MFERKETLYLKAISSIHAGTGQSITSVDMPIQREIHTNIPKIESSSLKGSIKHHIRRNLNGIDDGSIFKIFGDEDGRDHASLIAFTDAKLLFFPVKSSVGIFKLVSCPFVMKRWMEDISATEYKIINDMIIDDGKCMVRESDLSTLFLEEYIFECNQINNDILTLVTDKMCIDEDRIVIVSDNDFIDLVSMYTEIITRNRIDFESGTAQGTALFTEEYLPCESILYFNVLSHTSFIDESFTAKVNIEYFKKNTGINFQVGGNATIGKGIVKLIGK